MNKNVLIVLVGGFVIAVLVALLMQAALSGGKEAVATVTEEPRVMVVVASRSLKVGEELSNDNMRWQSWPENAVFSGAIVRKGDSRPLDMISGKVRRELGAGEPILKSALAPESANFLSASLGAGMRAVAIPVTATTMAGGFIGPGDYVDVILTYQYRMSNPNGDPIAQDVISQSINRLATETILQNVRVLAIDQNVNKSDERVRVGKTATLEVDLRGAEAIALARRMGDIGLVLRRLGDDVIVNREELGPVTTDERLTQIYDDIMGEVQRRRSGYANTPGEISAGQNGNNVRIYTGGTVQQISIVP